MDVLNEDYAKREGQCWVFLTKITLKGKDSAGCS